MALNKLRLWLTVACFALLPAWARADTWRFAPEVTTQQHVFGTTRIVITRDARENQSFPDFLLEVFTNERRVLMLPGVNADQVFASKEHEVFVGLSNNGIPGTAAIVFTNRGVVTLLASHRLAEFDYCRKSVTVVREWFDEAHPDVQFRLDEGNPKSGIYLRSCKGKLVGLAQTVARAQGAWAAKVAKAAQAPRDAERRQQRD